jgi:hypothetical protein
MSDPLDPPPYTSLRENDNQVDTLLYAQTISGDDCCDICKSHQLLDSLLVVSNNDNIQQQAIEYNPQIDTISNAPLNGDEFQYSTNPHNHDYFSLSHSQVPFAVDEPVVVISSTTSSYVIGEASNLPNQNSAQESTQFFAMNLANFNR